MKDKVLHYAAIAVSVILSFVLIAFCVIVPLYYSVTVFTKPETVVKLVQGIDYKTVIETNEYLVETVEQIGMSPEQVDTAIKSEEANKILGVYADDAMEILMALPTDKKLDANTLKTIVDDNIDKVLDVAEQELKTPVNKEVIKQQVNTVFVTHTETVEKVIPVIEPVRVIIETVKESKLLMHTLKPQFIIISLVLLVLTAVLIGLLRYRKLNGLIWLSVDFFLASIALLLLIIFSKNTFVLGVAEKISNFDTEVLISTINLSISRLNTGFAVFVALFLSLFVAFIVYTVIRLKRAKRKAAEGCDVPIEETTAENDTPPQIIDKE